MKTSLKILAIVVLLSGCGKNTGRPIPEGETPTRGNITIAVDDSYKRLFEAESYAFEGIYKDAKVKVQYLPELRVFSKFMKDSVRTMVVNRKLTKEEEQYLASETIVSRTTLIAMDALAFIVNKKNPDSLMLYEAIKNICTGKSQEWSDVSKKNGCGKIKVVFDNEKSGNFRYIKEKFKINAAPSTFRAVEDNEEVIKYVENHIDGIGLVSVNYVSDKDDSTCMSFLKRVKVVSVGNEYTKEYCLPYQAYIYQKTYPFVREVYMICREHYTGLGYGFTTFVAGDIGQRIILKAGLVPSTMPTRLVRVSK